MLRTKRQCLQEFKDVAVQGLRHPYGRQIHEDVDYLLFIRKRGYSVDVIVGKQRITFP